MNSVFVIVSTMLSEHDGRTYETVHQLLPKYIEHKACTDVGAFKTREAAESYLKKYKNNIDDKGFENIAYSCYDGDVHISECKLNIIELPINQSNTTKDEL